MCSIYLILLVDVLGFTIIFPLLPFYAEHFGVGPVAVGWLGTTYAICQLIASPVLGKWSDHWGRRPVLILSQLGSLASFLLLAFAPSFWWLCLARALDGMTAGNISVAYAYVADVTAPKTRGAAFALMSTVFGIGFIVGPSLSGMLFHFGYRVPILVAAGMSLLSLVLTSLMLQETVREGFAPEERYPWTRLKTLFQDSAVQPRLIQFGLFAVAFSLYFFGLPLFAERRFAWAGHAFGPAEMGCLYLAMGCVGLLVQVFFIRRLLASYGEETLANVGGYIGAAGYAGLAVSYDLVGLMISVILASVANALLRPSLTGLISRQVRASEQGVTMGALQSVYSLADLMAPLCAGLLIAKGWLPLWGFLMALLLLGGTWFVIEPRRSAAWRVFH